MGVPKVFIDGEAGTTGLQIHQRLANRQDLEIISIAHQKRKDADERAKLLNAADVAILCLPDAAAKEAVSLVSNARTKVLDASSAHRTAEGWVYGFPELLEGQSKAIAAAQRVSNPGCYPTGFLSLVAPVVSAGLMPADYPITINAISGYSGGGKKLISQYEEFRARAQAEGIVESTAPFSPYGLMFGHKHVKEMHKYSGLEHAPLFAPAVGDFEKGMVVQVPLALWSMQSPPTGQQLHNALSQHFAKATFVKVLPLNDTGSLRDGTFYTAKDANGTNEVQLCVFANDETQEALLIARLDNLGKGASGAAVQNLNIMLGLPEETGLR